MKIALLTFQGLFWLTSSYYPRAPRGWSVESRRTRLGKAARNDADCDTPQPRSVADYTLGLHGGKYQFDGSSGGGLSDVGQGFAAALYASDEPDGNIDHSTEGMPKWAIRLSELDVNTLGPDVEPLPSGGAVTITNEEPTWERFYAFVLPQETSERTSPSVVEPSIGILSPRGQVALRVQTSLLTKNHPLWLVVGTEEARWVYAIG